MPRSLTKASLHHRKPYSSLSRQQRWLRSHREKIDEHESNVACISSVAFDSDVEYSNSLLGETLDDPNESNEMASEMLSSNDFVGGSNCLLEEVLSNQSAVWEEAVETSSRKPMPISTADHERQTYAKSCGSGSAEFSIKDDSNSLLCTSSSSIEHILSQWAMEERNVPKLSITRLLKKLNVVFDELPKTLHELLSKPKLAYEKMLDGEYCHFPNWINALKALLDFYFKDYESGSTINYYLLINIDGLPLFRHSPDFKLYPILISVYGINMRPLCAGLYCSNKSKNREMPTPSVLLPKFLNDMDCLFSNPIILKSKTFRMGNKGIYVCDAPARASLKLIKSHTGYSACERCTVVGKFCKVARHVCLLDCSCTLRTNETFQQQVDKRHHRGKSPLCDFGVGMVSNFVLDYMHLVCLGTMKRLFMWWLGKRCNR